MSVQNGERLVTKQDLADMYQGILPYLGGMPEVLANKFSKGDLYSTDEKMIGQWIDGKPVYQKTITFSNITFDSANQYYYSLTGLDIDKAWVVNGFHYGGDYVQRPLDVLGQYKVTTWGIQNSSSPVPNSFYLQSSDGTAINRTFYITIQYTRTTDTAISIGSETEYSTDEKVVGTWIDGKPLYQKTIDCGTLPNATSKQITHGISNIDKFISIQGVALSSAENFAMPMVYRNSDATYNTSLSANGTYIILRNSQDRSMFSCYVTLQYTKTTDTPNT